MKHTLTALFVAAVLAAPAAMAQTADQPDTEGGRYILREVDGEYLRVDRESGDTSVCRRGETGWTCSLVADDRKAYEDEINRLTEENADLAREVDRLRRQAAAREDGAPELEGADPEGTPGEAEERDGNELVLKLPSDKELDELSETFETVMRRFVEMLRSLKTDLEQPEGN